MKNCFSLLSIGFLLLLSYSSRAQDVSLKISYKGQPVCKYEITIKHGDASLASGKTNDDGEVSFSSVSLLSKSIDVYGYKETSDGEKKFDIKGYVQLDKDNYAHIEMEKVLSEMGGDSGMPLGLIAAAWGLTNLECGTRNPPPLLKANQKAQ